MAFIRAKKGPPPVESEKYTVHYFDAQGNVTIRSEGSKAWRNNNPGNMVYRPKGFAFRHGASGEAGGMTVFPDEATGRTAFVLPSEKGSFQMHCFAPLVGIPEDPFTRSVLGGLTAYVDTFGLLPKNTSHFRVEQGHFIERSGVVEVEFSKKCGHYLAKVFAQATHCFSTEINLT